MGNYAKLIGAIVGNLVGVLFVWLAMSGIASCAIPEGGTEEVCTVLGFSQAQVTGAVMALFNMFFVWAFPPNKPT